MHPDVLCVWKRRHSLNENLQPTCTVLSPTGMIFYKKELGSEIDQSVFPGLQGGPHNHTIAGLAVALKMARGPEFVQYQKQIIANSRALCDR